MAEREAVLAQLKPERQCPATARLLVRPLPYELPYELQLGPQPPVHVEQLPGDPALARGRLVRPLEHHDGDHPPGARLVLPVPGRLAHDAREQLVPARPFGGHGDGLVLLGRGLHLYEGTREQVVIPGGMPVGPGRGSHDEQPPASRRNPSGTVWGFPDLAPVVVSRISSDPSKGPPTRPALALNSSMTV